MDEWAGAVMRWVEQAEGLPGYAALGLAALIEYVFPPFPGDTVGLFGVFLASTAGWSVLGVYLALNVGSIAGGMIAYAFGRQLAHGKRRPAWLRSEGATAAMQKLGERYARHGAAYLAINRFVPVMRSFFFVGAGIAGLRPRDVALWGGLSAALWNALLLALGWSVGSNWEALLSWTRVYSRVALAVIAIALVAVAIRAAVRDVGRRKQEGPP